MKSERLFRETPFGGYKREDVLDYLKESDRLHQKELEDRDLRLREQDALIRGKDARIESMAKELKVKTELAAESASISEEKEALQKTVDQLRKALAEAQTENARLKDAQEQTSKDTSCPETENGTRHNADIRAEEILADADAQAKEKLRAAEEQAAGILLQARVDAQSMLTEAEGQTEELARQVSDQAHDIISMTVNEAQELLDAAQARKNEIFQTSARSIGRIKGNLSSMQLVVKNIENELKAAKNNINERIRNENKAALGGEIGGNNENET